MHDYEVQEHGEDVRRGIAVCDAFAVVGGRCPGGAEDAGFDCRVDFCGVGFCVGAEELGVELGEDVADAVCFVG